MEVDPTPARPATLRVRAAAWTLGACGAYLAFRWVLGLVRLPLHTPVLALAAAAAAVSLGSIGLPIAAMAGTARTRQPRLMLLFGVLGVAVWVLLTIAGGRRWLSPPQVGWLSPVRDLAMILSVSGFGMLLAGRLKELNLLLPIGVFATFADFVVVNYGTVHRALTTSQGQRVLQSVSAKVPSVHPGIPLLTIGPADFLFLGVFLACVERFDLGLRRNALCLTLVLAASLVVVAITGLPVPALAPMSLTLLAVNWRRFRLTREEWISMAVVLGLAGALFLGYFLFVYPHR